MKIGLSLTQLAQKIEANQALKQDFIVPTEQVSMIVQDDAKVALRIPTPMVKETNWGTASDKADLPILGTAHTQIGDRLGIPGKYYSRMLESEPDLLATNVNRWLVRKPEKRMIRTLGGDIRAFLSNSYNRIENEEIAEVVLPILADIPDVKIVSAEITERRMYIQAVTPRTQGEVRKGDVMQAGVIISNSEIGMGSVSISPLVYRLVCLNGMVCNDSRLRATHVGRRIEDNEALYADDTRKADDRAVLLKVRDHVRFAVDQVAFTARIDKMRTLAGLEVSAQANPERVVEVLAKKVNANETERSGILQSLIRGGDLSAWGLLNAVTHQAHTATNYDRAVEFETAGGMLLDLSPAEWRPILQPA